MEYVINDQVLALRIVRAIAERQGKLTDLRDLAQELGVRRQDVRRVVTKLHIEGFVDALHMRLTMQGLALAGMLDGRRIKAMRAPRTGALAA